MVEKFPVSDRLSPNTKMRLKAVAPACACCAAAASTAITIELARLTKYELHFVLIGAPLVLLLVVAGLHRCHPIISPSLVPQSLHGWLFLSEGLLLRM